MSDYIKRPINLAALPYDRLHTFPENAEPGLHKHAPMTQVGIFLEKTKAYLQTWAEETFPRKEWVKGGAFLLAIATLFTVFSVQWSGINGRLAQDATYDDVGYFIEAKERLDLLIHQGIIPFLGDLWTHPPHSPFATATACGAFLLGGRNSTAPYYANALIVVIYLLGVARVTRPVNFRTLITFWAAAISVPLCYRSIHDFRPDFCASLLTAFFVWEVISASTGISKESRRGNCTLGGVLAGLALIAKPTFFPQTLVLGFLSSALFLLHSRRRKESLKVALVDCVCFWVATLIVAAPYYSTAGAEIWSYFREVTQGSESHIWTYTGGIQAVLYDYTINKENAGVMLSEFIWLAILLVFLGLFVSYRRKDKHRFSVIRDSLLVACTSLAIVVYGRLSSEYFGLTFQYVLVFCSMFAASTIAKLSSTLGRTILMLILLVFLAIWITLPRNRDAWQVSEEARGAASWNRKILNAISLNRLQELQTSKNGVYVAFAGAVSAPSMKWLAYLADQNELVFEDSHRSGSVDLHLDRIKQSDYSVIAAKGANSIYRWLPSFGAQSELAVQLDRDPSFRRIYIDGVSDRYKLYANLSRLAPKRAAPHLLSDHLNSSGLLPVEGPYPELQLPCVRWATFPEASLNLDIHEAKPGVLSIEIGSVVPNIAVEFTLNDAILGRVKCDGVSFALFEQKVALQSGLNQLQIRFSGAGTEGIAPGQRAALFKKLQLISVEP